ncbi:MAG: GWxTD domain-containing protein [Acidobacteriota bacterium]|nr:GWxTD domain-containing protein [Acidobacteriota bacterium]
MKFKTYAWIAIFIVLLAVPVPAQKKVKESQLGQKYRDWLTLVTYIILPQEKDVFLQLQSDFDRDIFIDSFWKQRDPTPGTPENEYRDEINKRFLYVNKEFAKDTPRPGWMTDRGRIYMIMGEPQGRDKIGNLPELHPCELWSYYGDVSLGQPTYFGLIFFRRQGIGEYTLYSPTGDGPKSLVVFSPNLGFNVDSISDVVQYIREYAPTIAPYTLSIIPQQSPMDLEPSIYSEMQMAKILDSPRKKINPSYATHFLKYKGMVSTEYLTNFVESEAAVAVVRDTAEGIPFLHYSIAPKSISVDFYEPDNKFYCNYSVDVSLKKGETFIYQAAKDFSYYFGRDESPMVTANGLVIQDSFPVIEGSYKLTVLLRNSIGKEFSLLERDVIIDSSKSARVGSVLMGYKVEPGSDGTLMAFKFRGIRLFTDPRNTFVPSDMIQFLYSLENVSEEIWRNGEVQVTIRGLQANPPVEKKISVPLRTQAYGRVLAVNQSFPASELTPDYYEAVIGLVNGGNVISEAKTTFIVSTSTALARPVILTKALPRNRIHLQYLDLARQAENAGKREAAEECYQRAMSLAPADADAVAYYCGFLMRTKNYGRALEFIEKVGAEPALKFDYSVIKGRALQELGRCEEAVPLLLEANKIYNSDTRVLNALGRCFHKMGDTTQALEVLKASLSLDPRQEDIKKLVDEIGKN